MPLRLSFEVLVFVARHFRHSFYVREIAKTLLISVGGTSTSLTSLRERVSFSVNSGGVLPEGRGQEGTGTRELGFHDEIIRLEIR